MLTVKAKGDLEYWQLVTGKLQQQIIHKHSEES